MPFDNNIPGEGVVPVGPTEVNVTNALTLNPVKIQNDVIENPDGSKTNIPLNITSTNDNISERNKRLFIFNLASDIYKNQPLIQDQVEAQSLTQQCLYYAMEFWKYSCKYSLNIWKTKQSESDNKKLKKLKLSSNINVKYYLNPTDTTNLELVSSKFLYSPLNKDILALVKSIVNEYKKFENVDLSSEKKQEEYVKGLKPDYNFHQDIYPY